MRSKTLGGVLLIAVPVGFTVAFTVLGSRFDYPGILRKPAVEILTRFGSQSSEILPAWWGILFAAMAFIPLALLTPRALGMSENQSRWAAGMGVVAGLVQAIGLSRWVFLVPFLAEQVHVQDRSANAAMLFEAMHRFAGMGLGEWMGYAFTALWGLSVVRALQPRRPYVAAIGLFSSIGIAIGCLEAFGPSFAWVGAVNAIAYLIWSAWLVVLGTLVLANRVSPATDRSQRK